MQRIIWMIITGLVILSVVYLYIYTYSFSLKILSANFIMILIARAFLAIIGLVNVLLFFSWFNYKK